MVLLVVQEAAMEVACCSHDWAKAMVTVLECHEALGQVRPLVLGQEWVLDDLQTSLSISSNLRNLHPMEKATDLEKATHAEQVKLPVKW